MFIKHLEQLKSRRGSHPFVTANSTLNYSEVREKVARTRGLLTRHGVKVGDRVAFATEQKLAASILYLACLAHGAVAVIMDPKASTAELTAKFAMSKPSLILADLLVIERCEALKQDNSTAIVSIGSGPQFKKRMGGLLLPRKSEPADGDTFPKILDHCDQVEEPADVPDEADALILFTSGTTSAPKGVAIDRGALCVQLDIFLRRFAIGKQCRIFNHLPLYHSDGLNQGPLLSMAAGAHLTAPVVNDMTSLGHMLDRLYGERATHLVTVPTILAMMDRLPEIYDDTFQHPDFAFIESTAGPLDRDLWKRVEERFGVRIVNCYGLTETVCEALYCGPDEESRKLGTVGKPDGFEIRIIDDKGDDVAKGESGELLLRGRGLMRGYFENQQMTNEVLREGWLHTGDLAMRDPLGFVQIVGRLKNLIIRGGINIQPAEINEAAFAFNDVHEVETIGLPDVMLGERVVTCVVAEADAAANLKARLARHLREHLSEEIVPNEIRVLPQLPIGPSGKVDLPKLRLLCDAHDHGADSGRPVGETVIEEAAAAFGASSNELKSSSNQDAVSGWDSLSFLDLIMRLERRFGIHVAPRDIMNIETLGDVIEIVERLPADEKVNR